MVCYHSRMGSVLKQGIKTALLSLLGGIVIALGAVVWNSLLPVKSGPKISSLPQPTPAVIITQYTPSQATQVEPAVIAKKIDLQRKLLVPKNTEERKAILASAEQAGATVVKSSGSALVIQVSKEQEAQFTKELEQKNVAAKQEVDYPVFVQADSVDWGIQKIEAPVVWKTTKGAGVKVAVVDTGIDYKHPDLQARYIGGYDFVNKDSDPFDDNGHGTHVSGIVLASANESGIQGVAADAAVVAVKVLGADGTGYLSDVVDGVDWAMKQGVQVMNFSFGTTYNSSALETKIQEAASKGIILIGAAGNTNGGSLLYPAAYTSVISVGATDQNDSLASFSSLGAEVTAPGVSIQSTIPGGGYAQWSGTSMAAPHVAGAVALMLANKQTNIRDRLRQTSVDLGPSGRDPYYGAGRIWVKPAVLGQDTLAPVVTFLEPQQYASVSGTIRVTISAQDEFSVINATLSANSTVVKSWSGAPYSFDWDTRQFQGQQVMLIASAQDDSGNIGAAQLMVQIAPAGTPTPSISPSPSSSPSSRPDTRKKLFLSPTPSSTMSAFPRGSTRSGEVRKDIQTPSMEHRQDLYKNPMNIPPVSNFDRRREQPKQTPTPIPTLLPSPLPTTPTATPISLTSPPSNPPVSTPTPEQQSSIANPPELPNNEDSPGGNRNDGQRVDREQNRRQNNRRNR